MFSLNLLNLTRYMKIFTANSFSWLLIVVLLLHLSNKSTAQTCPAALPSNQWVRGGFLAPATTCINQQITATDISRGTNLRYVFDYNGRLADTTRATTRNTFTYPRAGVFLIVQIGRLNNRPSFACAQIRVIDPPKPTFTVTSCGNATARLMVQTPTPYNSFQINWGDGSAIQAYLPGQPAPTHIYARSQVYMVRIVGAINGVTCTGTSDPRSFTPVGVPPTLPVFTKADILDEATAEFTYLNADKGTNYVLQQRIFPSPIFVNAPNATVTPAPTDWKVKTTGLRTSTNMYCYQFTSSVGCAGATVALASNEICTMPLNLTAQPYQNVLTWRPYQSPRFKQYVVKRDGVAIASITANATIVYTDTKVECGRAYKYQIVVEFNGTPALVSSSLVKEITTQPVALPTALTNVTVSVRDDKTTQIVAVAPTGVRVKRYILKTPTTELSSTTRTVLDTLGKPKEGSVCYQMAYEDVCGRTTPLSTTVCTIYLEARGETLRWTSQLPFTLPLREYVVQRIDAQGRVLRTEYRGRDTEWKMVETTAPEQDVTYRVQAIATNGTSGLSNVVRYFRTMKIFAPSAFTPNGDNNNETFQIQGQFIAKAALTILNRWGQAIYQTDDFKTGWNGNGPNGQPAAIGTYSYVVAATDTKGNAATQYGVVELLR